MAKRRSALYKARSSRAATGSLALFDARLGVSEWLAADRVTIADGILFVGLEFARMVRFKIGEDVRRKAGGSKGRRVVQTPTSLSWWRFPAKPHAGNVRSRG